MFLAEPVSHVLYGTVSHGRLHGLLTVWHCIFIRYHQCTSYVSKRYRLNPMTNTIPEFSFRELSA